MAITGFVDWEKFFFLFGVGWGEHVPRYLVESVSDSKKCRDNIFNRIKLVLHNEDYVDSW